MLCRHYIVKGRVQGVFFRASTQDYALQLGLNGWVRNLPGGEVELVACGSEQQLDTLEAWLHQGPPMASVSQLQAETTEFQPFDDFSIR